MSLVFCHQPTQDIQHGLFVHLFKHLLLLLRLAEEVIVDLSNRCRTCHRMSSPPPQAVNGTPIAAVHSNLDRSFRQIELQPRGEWPMQKDTREAWTQFTTFLFLLILLAHWLLVRDLMESMKWVFKGLPASHRTHILSLESEDSCAAETAAGKNFPVLRTSFSKLEEILKVQ